MKPIFVTEIFRIQMQLKMLHWQTKSFAEHTAFGDAYDTLNDLIDKFIESAQGKYGRIEFTSALMPSIISYGNLNIVKFIEDSANYFNQINLIGNGFFTDKDTALFVISDEIELALLKLSYFYTFDK